MPKKKHIKEYALRCALSKISKHEISLLPPLPSPHSPIYYIRSQIYSRLSEVPIFKKSGKNSYIRDPEKRVRFKTIKYEGPLLSVLTDILMNHYKSIQIDPEIINAKRFTAVVEALGELVSWKKELISSGYFNEKNFKKSIEKFALGIIKYREKHIHEGFSANQRTQLVKDLDECFFKFVPKLRTKKNARFHCIAYILKSLNLEEGSEEQIFGRIKVDFYRKI